jgi:hypothetical protein
MTGAACASSPPPAPVAPPPPVVAPSAGADVVAQPGEVPVEARGKRIVLTLPEGFTRDDGGASRLGVEASKLGDVLVASATRPGKFQLQIFYDPDVSVDNAQISQFGGYLVATAGKNLPNFQLGTHGVVTDKPANVFFLTFVDAKDAVMGEILIRSFAGSPLRVMIVGPQTIDGVRVLPVAMRQMVDTLGTGEP